MPTEDVGNSPGYGAFPDAMANPAHSEEHEYMKEWFGQDFYPNTPETKKS